MNPRYLMKTRDPNPVQACRRPGRPSGTSPARLRHRRRPGAELTALKERLLQEHAAASTNSTLERWYRLAAGEAEALAWQTPYPLLVLPVLLEEKLEAVRRYTTLQAVHRHSVGYKPRLTSAV